jgi:hypothetical protein
MPRNGNSGVASCESSHVSSAAAMTDVFVVCWRRTCRSSRSRRSASSRIVVRTVAI